MQSPTPLQLMNRSRLSELLQGRVCAERMLKLRSVQNNSDKWNVIWYGGYYIKQELSDHIRWMDGMAGEW